MRIALIVTDLTPPRIGGISRVATSLAEHYAHKGHDVEVFCLTRSAELHRGRGYKVCGVEPRWMLYRDYPVVSFSLSAFEALMKRHEEEPFDVSHAMNFNNFGLTFYRRRMRKKGLVHVSTAFETTQMEIAAKWREFKARPGWHNLAQIAMESLLAPWQRSYIGWGDAVTTEDEETREGLERMGIEASRVALIPSGVELKDYEGIDDNLPWPKGYWLCPGRVDPRKGVAFLIQAYAQLVSAGDDVPLLIVAGGGRGDHLQGMKALAKELKCEEQIVFTGRVEDLKPYYAGASAVMIPSLSEGIPITLQEALAMDRRVLCSKLKGTYAYAREVSSVQWFTPGSVEELKNGLLKLLDGDSEWSGKGGRAFMAKDDWSAVADRYLNVYRCAKERAKSTNDEVLA